MKIYILVLFLFSYCIVNAQRKPKIKGNKNVIEVTEDLPAFNAIQLNDDLDILLQKANREGYQLTADDNLVDVLKFRVVDSTLVISAFYKITGKKKLDITIKYYELNSITLNDGRIRMQDMIDADELTVTTSGSAKLQLNANASVMDIVMIGNSSGDFNLQGDSLNITLKDRIDVGIYAVSETNIITMQDNASAKMDGSSINMQVNLSGSTSLKAQKLMADLVSANLEGSSSAKVYAKENLELSSSGSSKTYLSGDAKIEILDFLDTSELHKEK
jgi:hypothetical protein